jgi:hypothetical protein
LLKGAVVEVVEVDDAGAGPAKAAGAISPVASMVAETATPKVLVNRCEVKSMK